MISVILEMAPLQGVTTWAYRQCQSSMFTHAFKYYTPFISPNQNHSFTTRELNEILPEHNKNIVVVPQLIGHNADDFIWAANEIKALGYNEVNLNLGCPSGTVTKKKKGSGLLGDLLLLDEFLDSIFAKCQLGISVKTRIGRFDYAETEAITEIYSKYPIKELIIHPRLESDMYKGNISFTSYEIMKQRCNCPVCYNGDLFNRNDVIKFADSNKDTDFIMCGRGYISNPKLAGEINGESPLTVIELSEFHDVLFDNIVTLIKCEKPVLLHIKEYWKSWACDFNYDDKLIKMILKSTTFSDYKFAVKNFFKNAQIKDCCGYSK